ANIASPAPPNAPAPPWRVSGRAVRIPNHAAVSTHVAASTGYSHMRTGISRVNQEFAMMSVGTPITTAVSTPAHAAATQRKPGGCGAETVPSPASGLPPSARPSTAGPGSAVRSTTGPSTATPPSAGLLGPDPARPCPASDVVDTATPPFTCTLGILSCIVDD